MEQQMRLFVQKEEATLFLFVFFFFILFFPHLAEEFHLSLALVYARFLLSFQDAMSFPLDMLYV